MSTAALDPVTLALVQNRLDHISHQMGWVMTRTARSPIFSQSHDFSCFIADARGTLISQADGIPIHTGGGGFAVRAILRDFKDSSSSPGIWPEDVFLLNDPYTAGGNHLPDWVIARPVFVAGALVAFACNRAHQADIGGGAAGTYNSAATEIFHEGIRLPVLKLIEGGRTRDDLWRLLLINTRLPDALDGDLENAIGWRRNAIMEDLLCVMSVQLAQSPFFTRVERAEDPVALTSLFESEHLPMAGSGFFDQRFVNYLSGRPELLQEINWRQFEGLTAEWLARSGYDVELGPGRDDGSVDVRAWNADAKPDTPPVLIVQCKREKRKIGKVVVKDRIADAMFQQLVLRPDEYSVIAAPNLNGDYLSDAAGAQVGGLGLAPGGNVGDGYAVYEATHGTAPKYAGQDKVNPSSVILSGVMMFEELGWDEVARAIVRGLEGAIAAKRVTYDLARQMPGATEVSTSAFADAIIEHLS